MTALTNREQATVEQLADLIVTSWYYDELKAMVDRCHDMMDEHGVPAGNMEGRLMYVFRRRNDKNTKRN